MRRHLATLLLCAAVLLPHAGMADMPADAAAKAGAALAEFEALKREAKGALPHWSDPKARPVIARLSDPALLGWPPYAAKDMPALDAVVIGAGKAYLGYADSIQSASSASDLQERIVASQDEIARFAALLFRSQTVTMATLADLAAHQEPGATTPERLRDLRQIRFGIVQMVRGAGQMARGMKPEDQAVLVDAVADSAAPIAAGLSMTARAQVAEQLHEQFIGLPAPLAARIDEAGRAMASAKCSGLCTLE